MDSRAFSLALVSWLVVVSSAGAFETAGQGLLVTGAATSGQAATPQLGEALARNVKAGDTIRVANGDSRLAGELSSIENNRITLLVEGEDVLSPLTMPFDDLQSVWKRESHPLWGAFSGAALGLMIGIAVASGSGGSDSFIEDDLDRAVIGIATALGAGAGAIAGSNIHSYKLIYPR